MATVYSATGSALAAAALETVMPGPHGVGHMVLDGSGGVDDRSQPGHRREGPLRQRWAAPVVSRTSARVRASAADGSAKSVTNRSGLEVGRLAEQVDGALLAQGVASLQGHREDGVGGATGGSRV